MAKCFLVSSVAVTLVVAALAAAAEPAGGPPDSWGWLVYPCLRAERAPVVDGKLDDPAWRQAVPVSGFRFSGTQAMAPYQMVMRLLWDDAHLYMAVQVEEPAMDKLVITAHGRDAYVFNDDCLEWFVDPWQREQVYFQFGANAGDGWWDSRVSEPAWDCDWQVARSRGSKSWVVEASMPLGELGGRVVHSSDVWGFNLCREREAGGQRELMNWANVLGNFHRPHLFGHLLFLDPADQVGRQAAVSAAAKVGQPLRLFTPQGWWQVNGGAGFVSYQQDLQQAMDLRIRQPLREIRRAIDKKTQPDLWRRYRQLADLWYATRRLGKELLGPLEWAHARPALGELETEVPRLMWEVKLAELVESL